jgi:putative redox protein
MAKTLEAVLEQVGPSTSKATVRSHTVFVDRPVERGGADKGPVGGEYQLVALAGCFTSHLLGAIKAREAQNSDQLVIGSFGRLVVWSLDKYI